MRAVKRLPLAGRGGADFDAHLAAQQIASLTRAKVTTLQVNVGKLCNQACHHCHVEAGPKRTEVMAWPVAQRILELCAASPSVEAVDLTGGAPELNPSFRWLVSEARRLGKRVIDRCNLTILFEPDMEDLPEFLAEKGVEIVASLPCYSAENVERQRGRGVFDLSIAALRRLNALGYGRPGSPLRLDLVYNPGGASLPPPQARLEAKYKDELGRAFGIEFHALYTITNMPISRFADELDRQGRFGEYLALLVNHFNPATVPALMCRSLLSVGWDGRLHDCDFNQMLDLPLGAGVPTVFALESVDAMVGRPITTDRHCFGCTAGAGSSCAGVLS